jgi:hypothetical protein
VGRDNHDCIAVVEGQMILIRKGMQGIVVGNIQQLLTEAGYTIGQPELVTNTFGDSTLSAVEAFQASHTGPDGAPLVSDGIAGENTLWALQHPGGLDDGNFFAPGWFYNVDGVLPELQPVLAAACGEIGVCEDPDGSNDGPAVRKFTAPDYIGDPWCMLFASWAYAQKQGGSPFPRMAACWALYDWATSYSKILQSVDPVRPGDILLILRGSRADSKRRGHAMLACGVLDDGRIATVAGNESNAVRGGLRERNTLSAIIRP